MSESKVALLCFMFQRRRSSVSILCRILGTSQTDFFESFKNYDEAGSPQRIQVLKWV